MYMTNLIVADDDEFIVDAIMAWMQGPCAFERWEPAPAVLGCGASLVSTPMVPESGYGELIASESG